MPRRRDGEKRPWTGLTVALVERKLFGGTCVNTEDAKLVNAVELMVDGGLTGAPFGAPILRG